MLKPIDNAEVKTKIQHEKMRESLKCFPTMKESKNHKLLSTGKVVIRQKASGWIMPVQKKKHSKSREQVRKEHTSETSSKS